MARKLWSDKIGEQKNVEGYVFTIIANEGQKVIIDVLGEKFSICRSTWNDGKFTKILRGLKPRPSKYLWQTQKINNVVFKIVEVMKNKVKVEAEGFEGTKEMAIQTWKNGRFFKNIMKVLKRIVEKYVEKYEIIVRPLVMKDFIGRITVDSAKEMEGAFENAMTSKEIRDVYKKYSKALHPDLNGNTIGNTNAMKYLTSLRNVHLHMAEMFDSLFDEE